MYKIREAGREDFPKIAAIHNTPDHLHLQIENPIDKQYFDMVISANDIKMYVVEKSGIVAAFILFRFDNDQVISIEKFSIDKSYRKKGLDEHLYHKVERLALRKGMKRMVIRKKIDNPDVYDFFERKGWQQSTEKDQFEIEF